MLESPILSGYNKTKISKLHTTIGRYNQDPLIANIRSYKKKNSLSTGKDFLWKKNDSFAIRNLDSSLEPIRKLSTKDQKTPAHYDLYSDTKRKMKITIQAVEEIVFNKPIKKNKQLLNAEISTDNSLLVSPPLSSLENTPSPGSTIEKSGFKSKNPPRSILYPARYLTSQEFEKLAKKQNTNHLGIPVKNRDSTSWIIESDKKNLQNELLFRKYRKHKIMKKLIDEDEDSWEWSSHGSSPNRRVTFNE